MTNSPSLIRPARFGDLAAIVDVHTQARAAYYQAGGLPGSEIDSPDGWARRRATWAQDVQSSAMTVLCAVQGTEVIGVVAMGPPKDGTGTASNAGELHRIHVRPDHWGRRIGGRLHEEFVRFLRDGSLETGLLDAWEHNSRALAFYSRHGWTPAGGRRPGPGGADFLRLRLDLGGRVAAAASSGSAVPLT
ncbi:GNAT family N-acetyltransferase [Streptomyces sp. NPDC026673]|uniref:GNAT family N-acetyltransferase n=1 Tax=Streptomyces sp. NPDC026673 TaxID=3155724 RepID=UPI0033C52534